MSLRGPDWDTDGRDWPHRESSRFVTAGGLRWHVQTAGTGPAVLLVHGTASATHTWAGLLPLLAARCRVVAPDLPGHGFTEAAPPRGLSLAAMAEGIAALVRELDAAPSLVVGHSAGATILADLVLDGVLSPRGVVVLNHTLVSPYGAAPVALARLAARVAALPVVASTVAKAATPRAVAARLRSSGSRLEERTLELYGRLFRAPRHVGAALGMMAQWDLAPLELGLPRFPVPVLLGAGERDPWFPPPAMEATRTRLPRARLVTIPGCGHLSHEERPAEVAAAILAFGTEVGALPGGDGSV